jgi:hypothetical protein
VIMTHRNLRIPSSPYRNQVLSVVPYRR